jgi:hypothetical protein
MIKTTDRCWWELMPAVSLPRDGIAATAALT